MNKQVNGSAEIIPILWRNLISEFDDRSLSGAGDDRCWIVRANYYPSVRGLIAMESEYPFERWRDLYVTLGSSSAALVGLLFVATSLHIEEIAKNPIFRLRARRNSIYLVITLVEAALILVPQPLLWLSIELIALNVLGLIFPASNIYGILTKRDFAKRGGFSIYRASTFLISFALGVAGAIYLLVQRDYGLYLITASYLLLIVSVTMNAWLIMLGVEAARKKRRY